MNIEKTTGAANVMGLEARDGEPPPNGADLLPEPPPVTIGAAELAALVLESNQASRKAQHTVAQAEEKERAAEDAQQVATMREQADNALVGGVVSAGFQVASAAVQASAASSVTSDLSPGAQKAQAIKALGSKLLDSFSGLTQAVSSAQDKSLAADAKAAESRAKTAEQMRDEAKQGLRDAHDLDQATLQAYQAILGSQAQTWQMITGQRA